MRFGFRELIFLVVLLAVPVASWWYVFKPRNTEIAQARMEIEIAVFGGKRPGPERHRGFGHQVPRLHEVGRVGVKVLVLVLTHDGRSNPSLSAGCSK